jgi:hypothetical protein
MLYALTPSLTAFQNIIVSIKMPADAEAWRFNYTMLHVNTLSRIANKLVNLAAHASISLLLFNS